MRPRILAALWWLIPFSAASPATYLIRPDGTGDFPTIQAGLDGSASGDTLLLADGVFRGPGNRDLDLAMRAARVHSQSADPALCAIDLEGEPLGTSGSSLSEFRNVEFRGGRALSGYFARMVFERCLFSDPIRVASAQEGSLELVDCTMSGGEGGAGGAGYLGGAERVCLTRCRVRGFRGAGLFVGFTLTAADCVFEQNVTTGALLSVAPWMAMSASLAATRCRFEENIGPDGMLSGADAYMNVELCTFVSNEGPSLGIHFWLPSDLAIRVTKCTMTGNRGGAEILMARDPYAGVPALYLDRAILAFRAAGGSVLCVGDGAVTEVSCCDIFGNSGGDWIGCIAEHYGAAGNFSLDPLFCDPVNGNVSLRADSPCAPQHSPADCELIGAWPVECSAPSEAQPSTAGLSGWTLGPIQPTPMTRSARLSYAVPAGSGAAAIALSVHDLLGRCVRTLAGGPSCPGVHWAEWDGRDERGMLLPAGTYYCRLVAGGARQTRPVLVVR